MKLGPKFVATLVAVALVAVLTALDQTVVSTALSHMITELQGAAILGWVFTAHFGVIVPSARGGSWHSSDRRDRWVEPGGGGHRGNVKRD